MGKNKNVINKSGENRLDVKKTGESEIENIKTAVREPDESKTGKNKVKGSMEVLNSFQLSADTAGLDQISKELYSNKEVLAVILKGVVREFEDYSYEQIMDFIEGDSITNDREVSPGRTNTRIEGTGKEYIALNEKLSVFDTEFRAVNPKLSNELLIVRLHIDVEPQKDYKPGYPIEKRGIYYLAREFSSQLSLAFADTDYNSLEKCYSIWICRDNIPKEERFSISFIEMSNTANYGECSPVKENYDLLTLVIIRLGDKDYKGLEDADKNNVLRFLHTIMYPHKEEFMDTVKEYIDFSKNERLWKEVGSMTGLGMSIAQEKFAEGVSQGITQGVFKGISEGVRRSIDICVDFGISLEDAIIKVAEKYNMTEEEVRDIYEER